MFFPSLIICVVAASGVAEGWKAKRMRILAEVPFTGAEPRDGKICRAAIELAAGLVNKRNDILPDYHIEVDFQDETLNSFKAVQVAVEYHRNFENNATYYESPLFLGPSYTPGCQSLGTVVHHLNLVTITAYCLSPIFTANRNRFPNMYRIRIGGDFMVMVRLIFVKQIIKWQKVAIVIHASNVFNYYLGSLFLDLCVKYGVGVNYFDAVLDIDEKLMASLKQSDSRVISVDVSDGGSVLKFLCLSYKWGITGSKYVFLMITAVVPDPYNLPKTGLPLGCDQAAILQQMKITFWIGSAAKAVRNNGLTTLGIDLDRFEVLMDDATSKARGGDYDNRHHCYDMFTQAVVTLDQAEKQLNIENKSLSEFRDDQRHIMEIVNATAANVSFVGLRVGQEHYSERVEFDYEPQYVFIWTPGTPYYPMFKVSFIANCSSSAFKEISCYNVQQVNLSIWSTQNGQPPRDSSILEKVTKRVSTEFFAIICTFAATITVCNLLFNIRLIALRNESEALKARLLSVKMILSGGSVCLAAASICYASLISYDFICALRTVLTVFGLSLVHGALFFCLAISLGSGQIRYVHSSSFLKVSTPNFFSALPSVPQQSFSGGPEASFTATSSIGKKIVTSALIFTSVNLIYSLIWVAVDTPLLQTMKLTATPIYDERSDTYFDASAVVCVSRFEIPWFLALAAVHLCLLGAALFLCYELRKKTKSLTILDFNQIRIAVANQAGLFVCTVLALLILTSSSAAPIMQQSLMAGALLLSSITITVITYFPNWRLYAIGTEPRISFTSKRMISDTRKNTDFAL